MRACMRALILHRLRSAGVLISRPGHRWLPGWRRPLPAGLTAPLPLPPAGMKEGGQALLGGLDCMVQRNFFGAQVGGVSGWRAASRQLALIYALSRCWPVPLAGSSLAMPGAIDDRNCYRCPPVRSCIFSCS